MFLAADTYINGPQFTGSKFGYYPYWWENRVVGTGDTTTVGRPVVRESWLERDGETFKGSTRWCRYVLDLAKSKCS